MQHGRGPESSTVHNTIVNVRRFTFTMPIYDRHSSDSWITPVVLHNVNVSEVIWHFCLFLCWGLNIIYWSLQKGVCWVRCDRQALTSVGTLHARHSCAHRWSSDCGEENGRSKSRLVFKEYFALKGQYHWTVSWHNQHDEIVDIFWVRSSSLRQAEAFSQESRKVNSQNSTL